MVVMLVLIVVLVVRTSVAKPDLTRKTSLSQELESSVNGSLSNAGIFLLNEPVEIFVGEVLFSAKKNVKDEVAL